MRRVPGGALGTSAQNSRPVGEHKQRWRSANTPSRSAKHPISGAETQRRVFSPDPEDDDVLGWLKGSNLTLEQLKGLDRSQESKRSNPTRKQERVLYKPGVLNNLATGPADVFHHTAYVPADTSALRHLVPVDTGALRHLTVAAGVTVAADADSLALRGRHSGGGPTAAHLGWAARVHQVQAERDDLDVALRAARADVEALEQENRSLRAELSNVALRPRPRASVAEEADPVRSTPRSPLCSLQVHLQGNSPVRAFGPGHSPVCSWATTLATLGPPLVHPRSTCGPLSVHCRIVLRAPHPRSTSGPLPGHALAINSLCLTMPLRQ